MNYNVTEFLNELTEQPEPPKKKSFRDEYVAFLIAFGIIGIAIGFVIGQAVNKLVTDFVKDIINPTIGLFLPANLANMTVTVTGIHGAPSEFKYGDLISSIINFAIIILLVFLAYKLLSKYKLVEDKTKPEEKKE
jgi:large conductance mechanosensitive channel